MHYGEKLENFPIIRNATCIKGSVTRSGKFLDFGQLFKAFGNNLFPLISQHS